MEQRNHGRMALWIIGKIKHRVVGYFPLGISILRYFNIAMIPLSHMRNISV
jgi:hypothetical protein